VLCVLRIAGKGGQAGTPTPCLHFLISLLAAVAFLCSPLMC
jgi:hypothetical protein